MTTPKHTPTPKGNDLFKAVEPHFNVWAGSRTYRCKHCGKSVDESALSQWDHLQECAALQKAREA